MQVTNVAMALPSLPLTIILVAFLDASVWNIILAICITAWTSTARIIRSPGAAAQGPAFYTD